MSYRTFRGTGRTMSPQRNRRGSGSSYGGTRRSRQATGQYIDPRRFVRKATMADLPEYVAKHTFEDFDTHQLIKNNLKTKGYQVPSPIQDQTIPHGLAGKDIIGLANTGTGKTAAFVVPVLHKLLTQPSSRALIVAPTRELAQQIEQECRSIGQGSGLTGAILIGGAPIGPQLRDLRSRPRIVVGTPGRIKDHIERRTLLLNFFDVVVLDEVDRMLDMGFIDDMRFIMSSLSEERQSFFFSATMDSKVNQLIQSFSEEPIVVSVKTGDTSEQVDQDVVMYHSASDKLDKLHDVLLKEEVAKIIVFDETQRSVERLSQELVSRGFQAEAIHGGKSQSQRQRALKRFKANEVNILVATDVAARGIDVVDITHVINYTVPKTYEDYTHRIGRAGRAGRAGNALTFVTG